MKLTKEEAIEILEAFSDISKTGPETLNNIFSIRKKIFTEYPRA